MPKVSRESAEHVESHGPVEDRHEDLEGYTVNFLTMTQTIDATPLFDGLPDGRCSCPHWGYVFKGRMWFRSNAGEESYGPGDAFYVLPGHTSGAAADSEFLIFSPSEQIAEVEAHMARRAQELQSA